MAMQIHGSYDHSGTDYTERVKEKQAVSKPDKTKEAEKAEEEKNAGQLIEPQDEYISSEKSEKKPTGLYRVEQDENGKRKIFYDNPKVSGDSQGKPAEKCVANTDKVDREIKKLKEEKQQLEQQIRSALGDEKKIRELEKKLAQVENELSQKDNDTYRRQNASVSK